MTGEAMNVETIRERVNDDWNRIVAMLSDKIALASVSAQGITGEHMKRSAQFVADQMKLVGIDDAHVVQSENPDGTPGAWEVVGSKVVDPQAPTVLLYAHHDVQPVPDRMTCSRCLTARHGAPIPSRRPQWEIACMGEVQQTTAVASPSIPVRFMRWAAICRATSSCFSKVRKKWALRASSPSSKLIAMNLNPT